MPSTGPFHRGNANIGRYARCARGTRDRRRQSANQQQRRGTSGRYDLGCSVAGLVIWQQFWNRERDSGRYDVGCSVAGLVIWQQFWNRERERTVRDMAVARPG